MPSSTFLNLPKEKRVRILRAAKKEFSRVPVEKAVIANIVKDAKIPRGSFYQYFDNINDLFFYLIDYMYGLDKNQYEHYLSECNGDVYEAMKLKFSSMVDKLMISENRQFRINVAQMMYNSSRNTVSSDNDFLRLYYFPEETGKNSQLINLLNLVTKSTITSFITNTENPNQIKDDYNKTIDYVKNGLVHA